MCERLLILVVEDHIGVQAIIERGVATIRAAFPDSEVRHRASLADAMLVLAEHPRPDAVVLDLALSDSTTQQTIARLHEIDALSPVVVITGMATPEEIEMVKKLGIEVIVKSTGFLGWLEAAIVRAAIRGMNRRENVLRECIKRMEVIVPKLTSSHVSP